MKSVQIRSFFWSVFPRVWSEYGETLVSLRIQFECGKYGLEKAPYLDTFHALLLSIRSRILLRIRKFKYSGSCPYFVILFAWDTNYLEVFNTFYTFSDYFWKRSLSWRSHTTKKWLRNGLGNAQILLPRKSIYRAYI